MNKKKYIVELANFPAFSMNVLGENIFVIRQKANKNVYLHSIPHLCINGQIAWRLQHGENGCELLTKRGIDEFFKNYKGTDLEPVKLIEVTGPDCSFN